ncbi:MAG TPA: carbohydrate ABC transporter permease [Anaerolineae bacterium]|nr:carbohydrate ABC transporter permease [Anaerolineae bacterium]
MANIPGRPSDSKNKLDIPKILMYALLLGYTFISLLPLYYMVSSSIMTLSEINTGRWWPEKIDFQTDITPCILFTTDTYRQGGQEITSTRVVMEIAPEVSRIQRYGDRFATSGNVIDRNVHFRIPFFSNYCAAWDGANLGQYMWNTIRIVFITIIGLVTFCTLAAYAFARMDFPGKNLLFAIMLATLMVPEMVTQLPNFLIVTEIGNFFGSGGIGLCEARNCWINNWPALTIPFMATPISIFLLRQHFMTIPNDLWDAARMDGAGHLRFLIQIVLPLSKAALFVVVLFAFIGSWNSLAWPILVTSGDEWRPISYGLQSFLQEEGEYGHLRMAGSMITTLPLLILYAFTQRYFVESLNSSGLKG